ncbi:MAG: protein kinase, partial [Muribaculaceae bacterium]|nr:protein kinase [Muribaculaceae bacterium]
MAECNSIITPHGAASRQSHRFVAGGGTCTCSTVKQHGRLLLKKQLLPEKAADQRHRQALEKEFEIGYALNHPNIPRYLEWHDDYILMEYVDGLTLTDFVRQHPAYFKQEKQVRQFLDELLSTVDYLHRHQVLHLDLKPDNIMMTHIGNHVKLIDLGYCYQDGFPFSTGGTPGYAAPEKEKTPASDIYSLGRIFS